MKTESMKNIARTGILNFGLYHMNNIAINGI